MRGPLPRRFTAALACLGAAVALGAALAGADVVQQGGVRVVFEGKISPHALPRQGLAPIAVSLGGQIATTDGSAPPQLEGIEIAINRVGHLNYKGLPACHLQDIQPSSTAYAQRVCGAAKVGEGTFSANVVIPEQSPFPSEGKIVAFNGTEAGKPVIFAHVYGTVPVPTSYTLSLRVSPAKGTYGTVLRASLPEVTSDVAFVTGISLTLNRRFQSHGKSQSYVTAGCPAPKGLSRVSFNLARASFTFAAHKPLAKILTRDCKVRG